MSFIDALLIEHEMHPVQLERRHRRRQARPKTATPPRPRTQPRTPADGVVIVGGTHHSHLHALADFRREQRRRGQPAVTAARRKSPSGSASLRLDMPRGVRLSPIGQSEIRRVLQAACGSRPWWESSRVGPRLAFGVVLATDAELAALSIRDLAEEHATRTT